MDWVNLFPEGFASLDAPVQTSYYFFEGILHFFQYEYIKAREWLNKSLQGMNDKPDKAFEKKVINYLIPLNMIFGNYPDKKYLEDQNLTLFHKISEACQSGWLSLFESQLNKYEDKFHIPGIYLFIEKLRNNVLRNLLKKIHDESDKHHIMKLDIVIENYNKSLEEVKSSWYPDADEDKVDKVEIEWILSGLIYKGYVRGYVSHEKGLLVLSKAKPFPELEEVIKGFGPRI